jgi:aminoglycoside/choline kinase family phosphotransferase
MSGFRNRLEEYLASGSQPTAIEQLTPDASTREYFRIIREGESAIACVYPEELAGIAQFEACLDVTSVFLDAGLPVARILSSDPKKLIIVHEDFGDSILRDVMLASDVKTRENLLDETIRLIAKIQKGTDISFEKESVSSRLKFDKEKLLWELDFFKTNYFGSLMKTVLSERESEELEAEFVEVASELENRATVLCHRDFHAANLMVHNGSLKIIDHQDARIGAASYDLVSLLLDRVTVLPTPEWLAGKRGLLLDERIRLGLEPLDEQEFADEFRIQTVQRCLKAIGTFSFQTAVRHKEGYTQYINPMFGIVLRACESLDRFPRIQEIVRRQLNVER